MNGLLVKVLLGLSLMGKAPVESVIVSIDKYQTPDLDIVYVFAEDHFGTPALTRQEQADFIAAVKKKKNAYVIAEDPTECDDSIDRQVKQFNDLLFERAATKIDFNSQELVENGSLRYLLKQFKDHKISAFGAECRQEIEHAKYYFDNGRAYDNLAAHLVSYMRDLKQYKINWLSDYWREHMRVKKDSTKFIGSLKKSKFKTRDKKNNDFTTKAVDIRILHALHTIMQDNTQALRSNTNSDLQVTSNDKKNIFIFAGYAHIYRVMPTLWRYFGCVKNSIDEERFSRSRFFIEDLGEADRNKEFIDRFKVNITDFFAQEEDQ